MARKDQGVIVAKGSIETSTGNVVYRGEWVVERFGKRHPSDVMTVRAWSVASEGSVDKWLGSKSTQLGTMDPESLTRLLLAELIG